MRGPSLWSVGSLVVSSQQNAVKIDGKWMPARSKGLTGFFHRLHLAVGVFTGRYDAVRWPGNQ